MGKHLKRLSSGDDLSSGRVFDIEKLPDGKFRIYEGCDGYFYEEFTADELRELAQEIIEDAGQ